MTKTKINIIKLKKILPSVLAILFMISILSFPVFVFAQTQPPTVSEFSNAMKEYLVPIFNLLQVIQLFLHALLWPILIMIGALLSNDLLFSGGMHAALLQIWSVIRDFANVLIVLILVSIAIVNIMGFSSKEEYQLPRFLPRLALAIIVVNLSFAGCKVILDGVSIVTQGILALPAQLSGDNQIENDDFANKICTKLIALSPKAMSSLENKNDPEKTFELCEKNESNADPANGSTTAATYQFKETYRNIFEKLNSRNIALVLAVNFMNITEIDAVRGEAINDLKDLTLNTVFSLFFFVIYATAFIALFVLLMVRLVVLWITIVLSPLMALGLTNIASIKDKTLASGDKSIGGLFISHAIVPIKISIVLTIGVFLINALKSVITSNSLQIDPASFNTTAAPLTSIQSIIAGLATVFFIWEAIREAMSTTRAEPFVKGVFDTVQGYAKNTAKMGGYIPLLPIGPKGEKVGLAAFKSLSAKPEEFIRNKESEYRQMFGGNTPSALTEELKSINSPTLAAAAPTILKYQQAKDGRGNISSEFQKALAEKLEKDWRADYLRTQAPTGMTHQAFIEELKKGNLSPQQMDEWINKNRNIFSQDDQRRITDLRSALQSSRQNAARNALEPVLTEYEKLIKEAEQTNQPLQKVQTSITQASALKAKIQDAEEKFATMRSNMNNNDNFNIIVNDQTKNSSVKSLVDSFRKTGLKDEELKEAVRKALISVGLNDANAVEVANQYIAYSQPTANPQQSIP